MDRELVAQRAVLQEDLEQGGASRDRADRYGDALLVGALVLRIAGEELAADEAVEGWN